MSSSAAPLTERRQAGAVYAALLRDQHTVSYQCPTDELGDMVGDLAEIRAMCDAQLVATVADAEQRGEIDASQCASTAGWVAEYGWHRIIDPRTGEQVGHGQREHALDPIPDDGGAPRVYLCWDG